MREGVEGWLFPAKEIGDWANWKGLELPGEEKGRGLPAGRRPTGAGLSGGERGWGWVQEPGAGTGCADPLSWTSRDTGWGSRGLGARANPEFRKGTAGALGKSEEELGNHSLPRSFTLTR